MPLRIHQEGQKENLYTSTLDVHLTFLILHLLTFLFPDLKKKTTNKQKLPFLGSRKQGKTVAWLTLTGSVTPGFYK